jgi:hypothetical protein
MYQILQAGAQRPLASPNKHTPSMAVWQGGAVETEIAFCAVLEAMNVQRYTIYFLSDNMESRGDVHTGTFSTKNFVRWLMLNEVGQLQATGPQTSLRTQRMIQGWMLTPNWNRVDKLAKDGKKKLIDHYRSLNNDERIKGPEQERLRERARASAGLVDSFDSSPEWADF